MHTVGAPSTSGMGAHPLIARLRQHVVPPRQPHQLSSLGFRAHPPNSPQGRAFLLSASPRSSAQNARSTAEMDSCGSSGPVPAARREEPGAPDLPGGAPAGRAATRKLVSLYWAKNWTGSLEPAQRSTGAASLQSLFAGRLYPPSPF